MSNKVEIILKSSKNFRTKINSFIIFHFFYSEHIMVATHQRARVHGAMILTLTTAVGAFGMIMYSKWAVKQGQTLYKKHERFQQDYSRK